MGERDDGLTLEGLAHRLETLERENIELRSKVATLEGSGTRRGEVPALRGSDRRRDKEGEFSETAGLVSRRSLLTKAGAAAVAAVAAGTLISPRQAKANHYDSGIWVDWVNTHEVDAHAQFDFTAIKAGSTNTTQALHAENSGSGAGVRALGGIGVWGSSARAGHSGVYGQHTGSVGYGLIGDGKGADGAGVLGRNNDGIGMWGKTSKTGYGAVYGEHTGSSGYGVVGDGKGNASGVLGRNPNATGVRGEGVIGVWGQSSTTGEAAVYARHIGTGPGVVADGWGSNHAGVLGRNNDGIGVWGKTPKTDYGAVYGEHTGSMGYGVVGDGKGNGAGVLGRNSSGYGGRFEGGKAQLLLKPAATTGKPSGAHTKGEVYMDSAGALFVCVAGGTPGTWRKVSTTAV